jgi:peptidoglycan hydrolase-like amidase
MAVAITRRCFLAGGVASCAALEGAAGYSFWVLGLLRPATINVYPQSNARLHFRSSAGVGIVEGQGRIVVDAARTPISVAGPNESPVSFLLEIPGVIRRRYFGLLTITSAGRLLRSVVAMDSEIAVGSIVGAELPVRGTPANAFAAQAVAARSFLCGAASKDRHAGAQFCDTTHCQFLRAPAVEGSVLESVVRATRGLVLSSGSAVIPAHYSAACGGHTDSLELDNYQYRSVVCEPCRRDGIRRRGHGLGLCQTGAISLARSGWKWREIVAKYYPGCVIRNG